MRLKRRGYRFIQFVSWFYLISLSFYPGGAVATSRKPVSVPLTISNLHTADPEVEVVQVQLKALGYYRDKIDGQYNQTTQKSIAQFQKATRLKRSDGVADLTTKIALKKALTGITRCSPASNSPPPVNLQTRQPTSKYTFLIIGVLGVLGTLGIVGAILLLMNMRNKLFLSQQLSESTTPAEKLLTSSPQTSPQLLLELGATPALPPAPEILAITKTSPLAQLSAVEQLIQELHTENPTKRRLAIWNLGQQGDSRAVQPLIDLMANVDSQQRGLILSALAEIGARTLKPMKRVLAISMQDKNPQVRQNAIRDLLRICDMMGQMSYILRHALEDVDPEVQATARYALNHLNHFNILIDPQNTLPEDTSPDQN